MCHTGAMTQTPHPLDVVPCSGGYVSAVAHTSMPDDLTRQQCVDVAANLAQLAGYDVPDATRVAALIARLKADAHNETGQIGEYANALLRQLGVQ